MAELAALGVAANVAQFVVMGLKSADYLYRAYKDTRDFVQERAELEAIIANVKTNATIVEASRDVANSSELRSLVLQSKEIAEELDEILQKLRRTMARGGRRAQWEHALRALWTKSAIEQLQRRLIILRDQISHHLFVLSGQSSTAFSKAIESLSSQIESNNREATARLKQLHNKLVRLQKQMKRAKVGDQAAEAFRTMADEAEQTAAHCLLRKRAESVLLSLRFEKISQRKSTIKQAHADTFEWALSDEKSSLANWLRSKPGIYWIEGKAGCGKSTLMKFLERQSRTADLLHSWAEDNQLLVVTHYFWAVGTELQRSLTGLFRTLLFQIFLKHPELLEQICAARMSGSNYQHLEPWTIEELRDCFTTLSTMKRLPSRMCFFIDGLDEFEGDHNELINIIQSSARCDNIKFCVSSRPWVQFRQAFGHISWRLCVHDLTGADIDKYARESLEENHHFLQLRQHSPDQTEDLIQELAAAASGVFLWVYLVTRDLLRGLTNHDDISILRKRLKNVPTDLEEYFSRILHNIDPMYHFETSALFSILSYTRLSLSTHLTWCYRVFRSFDAVAGGGPPGDDEMGLFYKRLSHSWDKNSIGLAAMARHPTTLRWPKEPLVFNPQQYSAEDEKYKITARCKDLIHVSAEADQGTEVTSFKVEFLHRSVAEFLMLPSAKQIIDGRLNLEEEDFMPSAALAYGYVEQLRQSMLLRKNEPDIDENFTWVLHLAKECGLHSKRIFEHIICLLYCLEDTYSGLIGAEAIDLRRVRRTGTEDMPQLRRFTLLVGTLGYESEQVPNRPRNFSTSISDSEERKRLRAANNDPPQKGKLVKYLLFRTGTESIDYEDLYNLFGLYFQKMWITILDDDSQISRERTDAAPLGLITDLFISMRQLPTKLTMREIWFRCAEIMANIYEAHGEFPSNMVEICQLLIRNGAPQIFDLFSVDEANEDKSPVTNALWKPAVRQLHDKEQGIITYYLDTARMLQKIPAIASRSPDGMLEEFALARAQDGADELKRESQFSTAFEFARKTWKEVSGALTSK